MTKHVPVIHSSEPTRPLTPRKPVDPVRRCCSQLRQPNPTTLKTAKSASAKSAAVVVRISGSPSVRSSGHEPLWRLARRAASIAAAA
ncbi:hypothetical protein, partial [Mycobacterium tuberculosis]|uniref:hypothetical protein n=4 Tax=Mycobacterium tuberculosis TaxID=1773 RepID=UPI000A5044C0